MTEPLTARRDVTIEWGDCDPAGIVFYPRYFAFFDAATAGLFAAAGVPKRDLFARWGCAGIPMVDTRARFRIPSRWGETITIESRIAAWKRSSFEVEHHVTKDGALAIEAWETRVWVVRDPDNAEAIRSRPVPQGVIERFARP